MSSSPTFRWPPIESACTSDNLVLPLVTQLFDYKTVQAIGYFCFLLYLFLGIAIIADIFMCAIEKITSRVKVVKVRVGPKEDDFEEVEVKVWNDTVANLTLMALGSSAPEILLSIIEIVGNRFEAGELGPGTIVGSAAFNLLIITGVCIVSIPNEDSKRINAIKVFGVTSFFGIFAYMWLFLILVLITPNIVDLWEAILTFLFFPILVFLAYITDRNFFQVKSVKDSVELGTVAERSYLLPFWALMHGMHGFHIPQLTLVDLLILSLTDVSWWTSLDSRQCTHLLDNESSHMSPLPTFSPPETPSSPETADIVHPGHTFGHHLFRPMNGVSPTVDGPLRGSILPVSKDHFAKGKVTKKSLSKFVRDLRKVDPSLSDEDAACLAATYIFENESHSRLFYRVSACRQMAGSKAPLPVLSDHLQNVYDLWKDKDAKRMSQVAGDEPDGNVSNGLKVNGLKTVAAEEAHDKNVAVVQFSSAHAVVLENAGRVEITLQRFGRMDNSFSVMVTTLDRTARAEADYRPINEKVTFGPDEREKVIYVDIIDDKNWNPDKVFLVRLTLADEEGDRIDVAKGRICLLTVTIVDDDEPGVVSFEKRLITVGEGIGQVIIPVVREHGSDGEVTVKYKTVDGSAKSGKDFVGGESTITFGHGQTESQITIPISNDLEEEKDEYFEVVLVSATGGAKLGKVRRAMVTVTNDDDYNNAMGKLMQKVKINRDGLRLHREAWIEQFWSAVTIDAGDENDDGQPTELKSRTVVDYLLHVMSFFWKVLFAAIPPVGLCGGWVTFFCSLTVIGILTAIVGDVASTFGCLVGLEKAVNAITFVALGTSLPDLFASRTAARMERFADNAIGNVTGSNSVNVFLGLGLPWMVAAAYWTSQGKAFVVPAGSLGFSVGLYTAVSLIATGVLLARRMLPQLGSGELGGPKTYAYGTFALFVFLWFVYIGLSALQTYRVIHV